MAEMNISPVQVDEFVKNYVGEIKKLQELAERFLNSKQKLVGWTGAAKEMFEQKIEQTTPAFDELIEVVSSYARVANNASTLATATENEIIKGMMG